MLVSVASYGQQSNKYEVNGYIPKAQKIYIIKDKDTHLPTDSVFPKNGRFHFAGKADHVYASMLEVHKSDGGFGMYEFYMEPGKIQMKLTEGDILEVTGTKNNNIANNFQISQRHYFIVAKPIYDSLNNISYRLSVLRHDTTSSKEAIKKLADHGEYFEQQADVLNVGYQKALMKAIYNNLPTYFAASHALDFASSISGDSLKYIYNHLGAHIQQSTIGKALKQHIDNAVIAAVNTEAPEFSSVTMDGKKIALTEFRGKYVMLDYWATWCGPCRAGNPHVVKLYEKYHPKGLEIVGIADDDRNVNGWKQAVRADSTGIWQQVLRQTNNSDKSGNPADLTKLYNVSSYPAKILIGPDGKIVARYGEGGGSDEDMDKMLAEIFDK